jgi:hypothetical protein
LRWALIGLLILHGLIHLMGFAKALGYAELPQLTRPISREWGVLWLLAGGLVVTTAVMLAVGARPYWMVGGVALLVSQVLIMTAWRDAWVGTVLNGVLLMVVVHGLCVEMMMESGSSCAPVAVSNASYNWDLGPTTCPNSSCTIKTGDKPKDVFASAESALYFVPNSGQTNSLAVSLIATTG